MLTTEAVKLQPVGVEDQATLLIQRYSSSCHCAGTHTDCKKANKTILRQMQAEEPSSISSDSSPRMEKTSFTPAITPIMLIQTLLQNKEMKGTEQSQPFTPRKTIKDVLQMIRNLNF